MEEKGQKITEVEKEEIHLTEEQRAELDDGKED